MGKLTTHVLDTSSGRPGAGIRLELFRLNGNRTLLAQSVTNEDGRVDRPLLTGDEFTPGQYELLFHAGDYLDRTGQGTSAHRFLDKVVIRFGVSDASEHYHVPLLLSPFGYSTYRGS